MHKDFLFYFKTGRSFNVYAIEMMVNIAQNDVLFLEQESHRAIWGQTVLTVSNQNWKGGKGNNIEADLTQKN